MTDVVMRTELPAPVMRGKGAIRTTLATIC